ncbi:response regulator [Flavobacterium zepuense]|uniref:Response regulator n=1 Tax=Flavobacterium zepuense TaxID=2593302 RepID=A0A552V3T8_9FLAO|nr:response regulator [Flavobacterium zepuense]TRW25154.1 response regulator [Flavobacterium zepuense]
MNLNGDIIIIEDDYDDREFLVEIIEEVLKNNGYHNKIVTIADSGRVIDFLKEAQDSPFLIISDINMPGMDGFQLRQQIFEDQDLNDKCIPYIFLTTSGDNVDLMKKAYGLSIQGYFTKPNDYSEYQVLMSDIIRYWKVAKIANRVGYDG